MMRAIELRAVKVQIEVAVIGRQFHDLLALRPAFRVSAAMRDQALDRANAQPVLFPELHQLRQPRHRSVVMQDFAKHARRLQPGQPREIHGRFRMTRAPQHAAVLGAQRKDVPRLDQIVRRRFRIRDRLDRRRPIVRADPRRHAARRIDRDGEIRAIHLPVLRHHPLQPELLRPLVRDRHTDQAAPVHRHEIDRLRRRLLRRHDEVALVLPIRIVRHDDHLALGDVADRRLRSCRIEMFQRFSRSWAA